MRAVLLPSGVGNEDFSATGGQIPSQRLVACKEGARHLLMERFYDWSHTDSNTYLSAPFTLPLAATDSSPRQDSQGNNNDKGCNNNIQHAPFCKEITRVRMCVAPWGGEWKLVSV